MSTHPSPFLAKHGRGMTDLHEQLRETAHYAMGPVLQRDKVAKDKPKSRADAADQSG